MGRLRLQRRGIGQGKGCLQPRLHMAQIKRLPGSRGGFRLSAHRGGCRRVRAGLGDVHPAQVRLLPQCGVGAMRSLPLWPGLARRGAAVGPGVVGQHQA